MQHLLGRRIKLGTIVGVKRLVAGWWLLEIAYAPGKTILARLHA